MDAVDLEKALKYAASKGKGEDTILAHISAKEVEILKKAGGKGNFNPDTGLMQFDSESGGEGPGGEGGHGGGGDTGGPGTGADHSGDNSGGNTGGGSEAGGPSGVSAGTTNATDKSAGIGDPSEGIAAGDEGVSVGKGFLDVMGFTAAEIAGMAKAGKMATVAGMLGVPGAGLVGTGLGVIGAANSMAAHGQDDPSNPGGNVSAANTGGVGMGLGAGSSPGGADKGGVGGNTGGGGGAYGTNFGMAPNLQTAADRGVAGLSTVNPGGTNVGGGFMFGAPPPTQTTGGRMGGQPFAGFGAPPPTYSPQRRV